MKLRTLEVENFGIFAHQHVELSSQFQLIHGPNEAGKSTLLELVRQVLFGFAHQNRYAFAAHSGEIAATATVELDDGRRAQIRRRKGRKNTVVGQFEPTGDPIDDAEWARLLGDASLDVYRNVFGFSLEELQAGEKSLKSAKLNEALFGGALGGLMNLQTMQTKLRAERDELYRPKSRTLRIDTLLREVRQQRGELSAAALKPRDYEQLQNHFAEQTSRVNQLRIQLTQLRQKQIDLQRQAEALPLWQQREQHRQRKLQFQLPEKFPDNLAEDYEQLSQSAGDVIHELEKTCDHVRETEQEIAHLHCHPELLGAEAEVRRLHHCLGRAQKCSGDLPQLNEQAAGNRYALEGQLRQLDCKWTPAQLDEFGPSLAHRAVLEELCGEGDEHDRAQLALEDERSKLQRDLTDCQRRLNDLPTTDESAILETLLGHEAVYQADCRSQQELTATSERLGCELELLRKKLRDPLEQSIAAPERLSPPLDTTVNEFRERFAKANQQLERNEEKFQRVTQELDDKRHELEQLDAELNVSDRDELNAQRARRDAGWQLVRRKYIRGKSVDAEIDAWLVDRNEALPDVFEREVRHADDMADQRQAKAELVARQEQLEREIDQSERRVSRVRDEVIQANTRRDELQDEWKRLWAVCQFVPLSPETMLDWLRFHGQLLEKHAEQEITQRQRRDIRDRLGDLEDELAAVIKDVGGIDRQLATAKERLAKSRALAAERKSLLDHQQKWQNDLTHVESRLSVLAAKRDAWLTHYKSVAETCGFPGQWTAKVALRIVMGLGEARAVQKQLQSLDERIADAKQEISGFENGVTELCQSIAVDLLELPATDAMEQLAERLNQASEAEQLRQRLNDQLEKHQDLLKAKLERQVSIDEQRQHLMQLAGANDENELRAVAEIAKQQRQCGAEIERLTGHLETLAPLNDLDEFEQSLQETSAAELEIAQSDVAAELPELATDYDDAQQQAGVARDKLEQVDGVSEAAEIQIDLESTRSKLAAAVDQWAPLVLADAVLKKTLERFELRNQPEMLRHVESLLKQITGGRYVAIRRRLDDQQTPQIRAADGQWKEPAELSTGTREQLYLAIRLAYVRHYCGTSESLPMVMDDILVNFDDQRARNTLTCLAEISKDVQIIFLTCHEATVQLAGSVIPDVQPLYLGVEAAIK